MWEHTAIVAAIAVECFLSLRLPLDGQLFNLAYSSDYKFIPNQWFLYSEKGQRDVVDVSLAIDKFFFSSLLFLSYY